VTIGLKVIALVAALFSLLGIAEVLVEKSIVMPSFAELERADARIAMRRIDYELDATLERLALSATDWGNWADTYRFMRERQSQYVSDNLTDVALRQLNVNVIALVDLDGHFALSRGLDLATGKALSIDLVAGSQLPSNSPWRANIRTGEPARGFLRSNGGVMMLVSEPVLDGNGGGAPRGMVIMGRLLSQPEIVRMGAQAQTQLALTALREGPEAEELVETPDATHVFRSFLDIEGHPIMTLRVDVPRKITQTGRAAVRYASLCFIGAALAVLVLLVIVLNRLVLAPLSRVTRHALAVGQDPGHAKRLNFNSPDEIGLLAREFDRMVSRLAESRRQLVDQSFQAGFAERARGMLHNLGNAMTPLSVGLQALRERLKAAPTTDAERALAELRAGAAPADRAADLEDFVRLACQELAVTVETAAEKASVLSRQAAVVQTALAEQMRNTRNEHVLEAVQLPELVAQSLEIVPDTARQRLQVDIDHSLTSIGAVTIARTVMRLVLQNLIINAADAVHAAGKARGKVRISAEVVRESDADWLRLHCHDDGVGIAAEDAERIFERGYSTKSKDTNYGIGLHWCANAVIALGGRMWASSEGPGRGACLHLSLPLGIRESELLAGAA
jgi:two-component system NtrC family sensor kinase